MMGFSSPPLEEPPLLHFWRVYSLVLFFRVSEDGLNALPAQKENHCPSEEWLSMGV